MFWYFASGPMVSWNDVTCPSAPASNAVVQQPSVWRRVRKSTNPSVALTVNCTPTRARLRSTSACESISISYTSAFTEIDLASDEYDTDNADWVITRANMD